MTKNHFLKNNKKIKLSLFLSGLFIVSYAVFIYSISSDFTYAAAPSKFNVVTYVLVRIFIGAIYAYAVISIIRAKISSTKILIFIFGIGLLSRLILITTEPVLEDDFNRYLWDGAVTANGFNAFKYPPKLFLENDQYADEGPKELQKLAISSGNIIERINHPHIRTIYPPIAQVAFAIAYFIQPWDINIWKLLLLFADIFVFFLLIKVLQKLKYCSILVIIYWWNPILLHEVFNAGHMDLLMYPFIVGAILLYLNDKLILSSSLLALAVGIKIWPIIFIPFVLVKAWNNKKIFIYSSFTAVIIIVISLLPVFLTKIDNSLGFVTYTKNWTNNESVFQIVNFLTKNFIKLFDIHYYCSLCATRWITVIFFGGLIIYFLKGVKSNKYKFITVLYLLVSIMFLISPTQFPWYYTWVLPLLVLNPRISFILYVILLPIYQLNYFWKFLVWIEHIPIVIIFLLELFNFKWRNFLSANKD